MLAPTRPHGVTIRKTVHYNLIIRRLENLAQFPINIPYITLTYSSLVRYRWAVQHKSTA